MVPRDISPGEEHIEFSDTDLHLCFGEGVRQLFGETARGKYGCSVIPVGWYELERISRKEEDIPREYDVLYATTNYYQNNLYVSGPTLFSDTDLWRTQQTILGALGRMKVRTAFKLHSGNYEEGHIRDFIREKGLGFISVIKSERSFQDLVDHSGLVVIDFPSTTLLQAVATKKPVFVLTRHLPLTADVKNLLRKRAYCCDDLDKLLSLLERFIHEGPSIGGPDTLNQEFLERYGVYIDDGKVLERVLNILLGLPPATRSR